MNFSGVGIKDDVTAGALRDLGHVINQLEAARETIDNLVSLSTRSGSERPGGVVDSLYASALEYAKDIDSKYSESLNRARDEFNEKVIALCLEHSEAVTKLRLNYVCLSNRVVNDYVEAVRGVILPISPANPAPESNQDSN